MVRLTELVYLFKKSKKWIIIWLCVFIFLLLLLNFRKGIIGAIFPKKPPPETVAFGVLPKYDLSDGIKPKEGINYRLQTISGNLPEMPKNAKVFGVAQKIPSFAAEEIIKARARTLKFNVEASKVSGSLLEFPDLENKQRTLFFDILSGNFSLGSNFTDPSIAIKRPKNLEGPRVIADSLFETMGLDFVLFPKDKAVIKKLKLENGKLVEADALINTDMVQVDYYYSDFDSLPTTFVRKDTSLVFAIVENSEIVYARKEVPDIEIFKFATYPLRPIANAWEELKAGNGYFNSELDGSTFDVKDIILGYVIGTKNEEYIQPVYIFKGENNFAAYISAVSDNWVEVEQNN